TETLTTKLKVARVRNTVRRLALAGFQSSQGHKGLVSRTDRIGAVQWAVNQRVVGRIIQLAPVLYVYTVNKQVRVERRGRHESQHFASAGLDRHQRTASSCKQGFSHFLQANIQRQAQAGTRYGVDPAQGTYWTARSSHFHF